MNESPSICAAVGCNNFVHDSRIKVCTRHTASPTALLFDILFPQSNNFRCEHKAAPAHCLNRAMEHCARYAPTEPKILAKRSRASETYPSTHEGVIIPFNVRVS
jgi:hypothetical protein